MSRQNGVQWRIPELITSPAGVGAAADTLAKYFAHRTDGTPLFTGSMFERFSAGGDRAEIADVITAEDLLAVSMLSVHVPAEAVLRLLGDQAGPASHILQCIPVGVDLVDASTEHLAAAEELWGLIRGLRGMGRTKTSKLLARKRPQMLPVIDSVVCNALGHAAGRTDFYTTMQATLAAEGGALSDRLSAARTQAGIGDDISVVRCFDILVWMSGTGNATAIDG